MAYSKVGISIPNVTGAIKIVVSTVAKTVTNLFDYTKATINARATSSGSVEAGASYNGYFVSDLMPLPASWKGDGTDIIRIYNPNNSKYNSNLSNQKCVMYIGSNYVQEATAILANSDSTNLVKVTVSNGVASFIGGKKTGTVASDAPSCTQFRLALSYNGSATAISSVDQLKDIIVTVNEEIPV